MKRSNDMIIHDDDYDENTISIIGIYVRSKAGL